MDTEPEGAYPKQCYRGEPIQRALQKLEWFFSQARVESMSFVRDELEVIHGYLLYAVTRAHEYDWVNDGSKRTST